MRKKNNKPQSAETSPIAPGKRTRSKLHIDCFASSNPHPPHSRAYDREHGCVNSSMVLEWLGAYDCSTSFALRALSTCLCVNLHLSASRSKSQAPSKKKPAGGFSEAKHEGTRLAGGRDPLANAGEMVWLDSGRMLSRILARDAQRAGKLLWDTQRDARRGCSGGILGGIHW